MRTIRRVLPLVVTSTVLCAAGWGQTVAGVWTQTGSGGPPSRYDHAMAYDRDRGVVVLFGGLYCVDLGFACSPTYLDDTWEWDGSLWIRKNPANKPARRQGHAMAYDESRGVVVLFGGGRSSGTSDTWEWDGVDWTLRSPSQSPLGRVDHAMVYDRARRAVLLFGGRLNSASLDDTWEWDGETWTHLSPAASPSARYNHALAWDSLRGRVVLFGGAVPGPFALNDTWEWEGTDWVQQTPATNPPSDFFHTMAYHPVLGRTVLFIPSTGPFGGPFHDETWEWDGTDWTLAHSTTSMPEWILPDMVYQESRGRLLLFTGDGSSAVAPRQTWEYHSSSQVLATYALFALGCFPPGSGPLLQAGPASLPWIGETFVIDITNLPPGNPAWMLVGASSSQWGSLSLPQSLGGIGMPGCVLVASGELVLPLVTSAGASGVTLDIPNDLTLVGASIYTQVFARDPGANPLGLRASDGFAATVGTK